MDQVALESLLLGQLWHILFGQKANSVESTFLTATADPGKLKGQLNDVNTIAIQDEKIRKLPVCTI
jgi:hypothetical protein